MTLHIKSDIEMGYTVSGSNTTRVEPSPQAVVSPSANCCGRIFVDWTQVVGGLCLIGGFCVGGVGVALEVNQVMISGAVSILASSILLCGRISCLKPKKQLEKQVEALSEEVARLTHNKVRFERTEQELKQVLIDAQVSVGKLGDVLKVPVDSIEGVSNKIEAIEQKLCVLVDLYHRYKATTAAFSKELKIFSLGRIITNKSVLNLEKELDGLDQIGNDLTKDVDEYQDAANFQDLQNREFSKMLSGLKADFGSMQERFVYMQTTLSELSQHVAKIDEADDKFKEGGEGFRQGVTTMQQDVLPRMQRMLETLTEEVDELSRDSDQSSLEDFKEKRLSLSCTFSPSLSGESF